MGSWFSNVHIRSNGLVTIDGICQHLIQVMANQQYECAKSPEEADGAVAVMEPKDGKWFSLYSDLLTFAEPAIFAQFAHPVSELFHTDVLGIACFDSDYLYLNLINAEEKVDAWINAGSTAGIGIRRRTGLKAWKNKVIDFTGFSESVRDEYSMAEELLWKIAPNLELSEMRSGADFDYLDEFVQSEAVRYLYFKLPDTLRNQEPPALRALAYSLSSCKIGTPQVVTAVNTGGKSRGLSVFFTGPYVENEEITFSEVSVLNRRSGGFSSSPIALEKVQIQDGRWAYYYHDPQFLIPEKVDDRLSPVKQIEKQYESAISLRFIPQGNPRKVLDITVHLVPDQNPQGQFGWNVWAMNGSKRAFIEEHNSRMRKISQEDALLNPEDFDL